MSCLAVWWHSAGPELLCNVTVSAGGGSPAGTAVAGITAKVWAWLCVQTTSVFRKPLSSAASQLCPGIPDFQIVSMGSDFCLKF